MAYGLNKYQSNNTIQLGFKNFQWVLPGTLARSSQPNYRGHDQPQELSFLQVDFLKRKGITCIISSNEYPMVEHSKTLLKTYGISYYHFKIGDFRAASPEQLLIAADIIETNRKKGAALVYCGFGQGRTGTVVAGWAMTKHMPKQAGVDINAMCNQTVLGDNFGVERPGQVEAIRAAAKLPQAQVAPGNLPLLSGQGSGMSFPGGLSGISLPDDASVSSHFFPNFGSGGSGLF
ncbi:hypothetical protein [Hahella ganghwensis]|uniref:phosphatase domain-containing putative toxin n=1 Tax=Hahella ganghwensis TaxID=286420 RepID=UPI00037B2833|nr:hypothetical protein [Hahella ganghwensis]